VSLSIEGFILLIVGVLAVLYRKAFARLVIWYHRRRWCRQKEGRNKLEEYPARSWSVSNRIVQIYAVIIGTAFVIGGIFLLLNLPNSERNLNVIYHSEDIAAQRAVEFLEAACIQRNYRRAYLLLAKNLQSSIPFEEFERFILATHPAGFPKVIRATHYEPIPGQRAMNVFLDGENEKAYYRLIMEGTKETNYKVSGIYRSETAYPASKLRRLLKTNFSTGTE